MLYMAICVQYKFSVRQPCSGGNLEMKGACKQTIGLVRPAGLNRHSVVLGAIGVKTHVKR